MAIVCNIKQYREKRFRGLPIWDRKCWIGLGIVSVITVALAVLSAAIFFSADADTQALQSALERSRKSRNFKSAPEVRLLVEILRDENPVARKSAAESLAESGPNAGLALPSLLAHLTDEDYTVRAACADTLAALGRASVAVELGLAGVLRDEYHYCRLAAASALWELGIPSPEAAIVIHDALRLELPESVRDEVSGAFRSHAEPGELSVERLIRAPEKFSKGEAVEILLALREDTASVKAALRVLQEALRP